MPREVQVRPAFAALYPGLSPERWYTAAAAAGRVKGIRLVTEGLDIQFRHRILDPDHFVFRGGAPRHGSWVGLRTRRLDRHPVPGMEQTGHLRLLA